MDRLLTIEVNPPPAPKKVPPKREKINYPFEQIPVGGAARVSRALDTVRKQIYLYRQAHPEQKFKVARITPTMTRIWRIK